MEEKKVPWWRKALSFALDGIRSGFGLFSKTAKQDSQDEPESPSAQQETPEETELAKHSPEFEPIAATANEVESVAVAEPVDDRLLPEETKPQQDELEASEPEEDWRTNLRIELSGSEEAAAAEEVAPSVSHSIPSTSEASEDVAPPEPEVIVPADEDPEPSPDSAVDIPAPQEEPETDTAVEAVALDEPAAVTQPDITPKEAAEESPEPLETFAEPAPEGEIEPETEDEIGAEPEEELEPEPEISIEPEALTAPIEQPMIVAAASADVEVEPVVEIEALAETSAEPETAVEPPADEEEIPAPAPEQFEPAEQITEPEPAPEVESAAEPVTPEPVIIEEPASALDSVPEPAVSSVELSEPVSEEVTPQTIGRSDAVEEESEGEVTPDPEAAPQTEHVAGPVTGSVTEQAAEEGAEEAPEPVIEPMDLKEPIPEQAAEPAEANEAVPVAEEVAGEAVPDEEAPETAAEAAVPEEEAASEPPEVDEPEVGQPDSEQAEVELVTAVAAPTAVPTIGAAPEAASAAAPASASETAPPAPPHKPFIKLESRDNEADLSPFSVIVSQVYDGPLDLLLDLIRKQDIDVYDIPIARITAQFLAYVNQLKATDVDVAGEFIYTASLLIHIKSKMLLPRAPSGQDDAAEDPRRELVERLLEHERFKNAAQMLQQKQMLEAATWTNPGLREFQDDTSAEPEIAADTVDLVRIFRDILERARNRPVIDVEEDSVTVGQMIQFLARRLTMEDKPVALRRLLSHTRSERALIAMFLALLELVRLQAILLRQDLAFSEIFIKKHTGFEAVMNEGAASARDDWR